MSATGIIGVKFTPSEPIETTSHKRGCTHPPVEGMEFCGQCGAPLWKPQTTRVYQFDNIDEEFTEPVLEKLDELFDGHAVVEADNGWDNFYIGYGATCDDFEEKKVPAINPEFIFDDLKAVLTEFEVWEQCRDSFGFWVVSTGH